MPTIVYVKWEDATSDPNSQRVDGALKTKPTINESGGILLGETEEYLTFTQDIWRDIDGDLITRHIVVLPHKYIIERQTWEVNDGKSSEKSARK